MVTACTDIVVSAAVMKPGKTQQLEPQENKDFVFQVLYQNHDVLACDLLFLMVCLMPVTALL
jgi:hypothetical protein